MLKKYFSVIKIAKQHFPDWWVLVAYPLFSKVEIIQEKNKIIAFASYSFGRLHYLGVDKNHQSQGFGGKLINIVKPHIRSLKVGPKNKLAQHLYTNKGFIMTNECRSFLGAKRNLMRLTYDIK